MSAFNDHPSQGEGQWYTIRPVDGRAEGIERCPGCDSPAKGHRSIVRNREYKQYGDEWMVPCGHLWHDEVSSVVGVAGTVKTGGGE